MFRKLLILGIIILSALIGVLFIYNFILKEKLPPKKTGTEPKKEAFWPELKQISREPVISPTLNSSGAKIKYYLKNGKVTESDFDGLDTNIISNVEFSGLKDVIWSPQKNRVISIYENGNKYFYDYNTRQQTKLHSGIRDVNWSENGEKIAYQFIDARRNSVNISNADGGNWQALTFYSENRQLKLDWISDKIYFYPFGSGNAPSSLDSVDTSAKTSTNILFGVYGLSVNWAPNGEKFLFSHFHGQCQGQNFPESDGHAGMA